MSSVGESLGQYQPRRGFRLPIMDIRIVTFTPLLCHPRLTDPAFAGSVSPYHRVLPHQPRLFTALV
jgi:hypothetical protein